MHPLFLASLVLEPDLDNPHGQASVLGQLFPHGSGWLWVLVEDIPQHLQLFCLDGGPGTASLSILAFLFVLVIFIFFIIIFVRLLRRLGKVGFLILLG